jgi:hypothetical protein
MTRAERRELLADLRAARVREYVCDGSGLVRVVFEPGAPRAELVAPGPPPGQPHTEPELVDAGGGLMVDPDLLAHEA